MKLKTLLILGGLLCAGGTAFGQDLSVKTNALYWGTTTPNLAFELGMGPRTTLELAGGYNRFTFSENKKLKHYLVQPAVRHWFCERFAGTFVGLHLHAGEFNVGGIGPFTTIKNNRYEGWLAGAGVSVGHQWVLGKRWGLEAELGVGYAYIDYDKFGCGACEPLKKSDTYHYFGPTRLNVSLVYYLW